MNRFYRNLNDQDKKEFILGFVTIILLIVPLVFLSSSASSNPSSVKSVSTPKSVNKYSGQYSGNWEGFLLNQYNTGSASFYVSDDGSAKLSLRGKFSAVHNGYISGDYFVINSNNEKCRIVDMGDGSFKVPLIWTGVNVDVFF